MSVEYVVSGCLSGLNCRYDGGSNPSPQVVALVRAGRALPICPESLSGLPCPRPPCEQKNGRVICANGEDLTREFNRGCELALREALKTGCKLAILKSRSPSCGFGQIYDGSFSRKLIRGDGLWARKLAEAGFKIYSEENLPPK